MKLSRRYIINEFKKGNPDDNFDKSPVDVFHFD